MSGIILRKSMKDIASEEWGWVAGRVVSFCNLDVNQVSKFGNGVSTRTLGKVTGSEEDSNINVIINDIAKAPIKSIYINHNLVNSVNNRLVTAQDVHLSTHALI